jgi:hypothetical protein
MGAPFKRNQCHTFTDLINLGATLHEQDQRCWYRYCQIFFSGSGFFNASRPYDEAVGLMQGYWPSLFEGKQPGLLKINIREDLYLDIKQRELLLSHNSTALFEINNPATGLFVTDHNGCPSILYEIRQS